MTPMSPGVMGAPGAEIAHIGSQIEHLGEYGVQVANAIQKAQDHTLALQLENSLDADLNRELLNYQTRTDFQNFSKDSATFLSDLQNRYSKMTENNPLVSQAFNLHFQGKTTGFSHAINMKMIDQMTKEAQYQWTLKKDNTAQRMAEAVNPGERDAVKKEFEATTEILVGSRLLTREHAYKGLKELDRQSERAKAIIGVNSDNPTVVNDTLDLLKRNGLPTLTATENANLVVHGEKHLDTITQKAKVEANKLKTTATYTIMKDIATSSEGTDFNFMGQLLANPIFQKEQGLTIEQVRSLEVDINSEEARFNKQKKEWRDKEEDNIQHKLSLGTLKVSDIQNTKYLTADERHMWEERLRKRSKLTDEEVDPLQDAENYIRINKMIDLGVDPKTIKDSIATTTHMKVGTRFKLLDRVDTEIEKDIKAGMAAANKILHTLIAPTGGGLWPTLPEEQANSQKAQMALNDWVKTQQKLATAGKRQPLTERGIYDHAVEMVPHYQLSLAEYIEARKREEAREKSDYTPGYTPGQIYIDASGRKAKYMGKNKEGKDQWKMQKPEQEETAEKIGGTLEEPNWGWLQTKKIGNVYTDKTGRKARFLGTKKGRGRDGPLRGKSSNRKCP